MWHFVVYAENHQIKSAALKALQQYDYNNFKLANLPEDFRQNIALPSEYLKNLAEGEPAPQAIDVLPYVPGECWLQVLQFVNHSASEAASDLVAHYIRNEVGQFKSSVYILPEGHPEPKHVNRLSRQSPLKAVLKYLLAESQKPATGRNYHLTFYSLRSISFVFTNPMPSLQWNFLTQLMQPNEHEPEVKQFCLHILTNQMRYSPSATQTIENYLLLSVESGNMDELAIHLEIFPTVALWIGDELFVSWISSILEFSFKQSQSKGFQKGMFFYVTRATKCV